MQPTKIFEYGSLKRFKEEKNWAAGPKGAKNENRSVETSRREKKPEESTLRIPKSVQAREISHKLKKEERGKKVSRKVGSYKGGRTGKGEDQRWSKRKGTA